MFPLAHKLELRPKERPPPFRFTHIGVMQRREVARYTLQVGARPLNPFVDQTPNLGTFYGSVLHICTDEDCTPQVGPL
jgi:hypothetical protein